MRNPEKLTVFGLVFLTGLFSSSSCLAGAWVRDDGEFFLKTAVGRSTADRVFDTRGRRLAAPTYREESLSFYGEYGVTERWTTIAATEIKRARRDQPGGTARTTGPADLWLGLKRGLLTAPFVLSTQLGAKVPLGYDERDTPPLGDGQVDLEARILAGKSFGRFYGSAEIGYRKRNGDYSDERPYRLEAGARLHPALLLTLSLDGVDSLGGDRASTAPSGSLDPNVFDKEYQTLRPALIYFFGRGYSAEIFYKETIDGANASVDRGGGLGLAWQGRRTSSGR